MMRVEKFLLTDCKLINSLFESFFFAGLFPRGVRSPFGGQRRRPSLTGSLRQPAMLGVMALCCGK